MDVPKSGMGEVSQCGNGGIRRAGGRGGQPVAQGAVVGWVIKQHNGQRDCRGSADVKEASLENA